jgi:hypothetical protein
MPVILTTQEKYEVWMRALERGESAAAHAA